MELPGLVIITNANWTATSLLLTVAIAGKLNAASIAAAAAADARLVNV